MNPRTRATNEAEVRLMDITAFCQYSGLGRTSARKLAEEAGAVRKYGKRILIDKVRADSYFDRLASGADNQ